MFNNVPLFDIMYLKITSENIFMSVAERMRGQCAVSNSEWQTIPVCNNTPLLSTFYTYSHCTEAATKHSSSVWVSWNGLL